MGAFVRQLAVLSVLWSLCELLLPDGKQQKLVRMAVSLLVMAALIGGVEKMLHAQAPHMPAFADKAWVVQEQSYADAALRAAANSMENLCVHTARRAGYDARAAVYLTREGAVERIELRLSPREAPPLMDAQALCAALARQLNVPTDTIRSLQTEGS